MRLNGAPLVMLIYLQGRILPGGRGGGFGAPNFGGAKKKGEKGVKQHKEKERKKEGKKGKKERKG